MDMIDFLYLAGLYLAFKCGHLRMQLHKAQEALKNLESEHGTR